MIFKYLYLKNPKTTIDSRIALRSASKLLDFKNVFLQNFLEVLYFIINDDVYNLI